MTTTRCADASPTSSTSLPTTPRSSTTGQWFTWGQLGAFARQIANAGRRPARQVGVLLRNRPAHVAALLGVLLAGGTVVVINPSRGDDRTRADIAALGLPVLIGDPDDSTTLVGHGAGHRRW